MPVWTSRGLGVSKHRESGVSPINSRVKRQMQYERDRAAATVSTRKADMQEPDSFFGKRVKRSAKRQPR
jgi:hypothetical protein